MSSHKQVTESQKAIADKALAAAVTPTRSLLFYTLTATLPLIVIGSVLLFTKPSDTVFMTLGSIGFLISVGGLVRLLYEITLDIAGFPDSKLPIWAVFYLIIYLISAFTYLYFAMHSMAPGRYFTGLATGPKAAFLDSLYLSLSNYVGMSPDSSISIKSRSARFTGLIQSVLSMFVNVVIITKFVNTF